MRVDLTCYRITNLLVRYILLTRVRILHYLEQLHQVKLPGKSQQNKTKSTSSMVPLWLVFAVNPINKTLFHKLFLIQGRRLQYWGPGGTKSCALRTVGSKMAGPMTQLRVGICRGYMGERPREKIFLKN